MPHIALLAAGATIESSGVDLTLVATNGLKEVVERLLPWPPEREVAHTGVASAADNGYNDVVEVYLRHADTRTAEWAKKYGRAANSAMFAGYDDTARMLFEARADLTESLHTAARFSSPGVACYLLGRGRSPTEVLVVQGVKAPTTWSRATGGAVPGEANGGHRPRPRLQTLRRRGA